MNGGQQDESKGVMTDSGDEEVGGIVFHSGAGGAVLFAAQPAHHEAGAAAHTCTGEACEARGKGLQDGFEVPELLQSKELHFEGDQEADDDVDMGLYTANAPREKREAAITAEVGGREGGQIQIASPGRGGE